MTTGQPTGIGRVRRGFFFGTLAVDALGTGLFAPISLLYFTQVSGIGVATVGILLSVANAATLPVPLLVGHLVDRFGALRVVVVAQVVQAVGFFAYLTVASPPMLLVAAFTVAVGQRSFWSSVFTLVSDLSTLDTRRARDEWFAVVGMAQAAGYGLGGLVAGMMLSAPEWIWRSLITINAGTFMLAAAVLTFGFSNVRRHAAKPRMLGGYRTLLADRPFQALVLLNSLFTLAHSFLGIALPLYVTRALPEAPNWIVGPLLAMNTTFLALGQARAVRAVRPISRPRVLALAGVLWAIWGVGSALAILVPGPLIVAYLVLVTLCFTAAELIHAPTSNTLASTVAPSEARGRYLAVFQYSFTLSGIAAPGLFGVLFSNGPTLPWLAIGGLTSVGALGMLVLEKRLPRHALRQQSAESKAEAVS